MLGKQNSNPFAKELARQRSGLEDQKQQLESHETELRRAEAM